MKKKAHEEEVSACEWEPKSKQSATPETNTETLLPATIPQFSYLGSNHSLVFFIRSQIYAMLFFAGTS